VTNIDHPFFRTLFAANCLVLVGIIVRGGDLQTLLAVFVCPPILRLGYHRGSLAIPAIHAFANFFVVVQGSFGMTRNTPGQLGGYHADLLALPAMGRFFVDGHGEARHSSLALDAALIRISSRRRGH
jgi:hypothetical protein